MSARSASEKQLQTATEGHPAFLSPLEEPGPPLFLPFAEEAVERSLPARFEEQVHKFPDRIAVKTRKDSLTYRQLNQKANRIARAILLRCDSAPNPIACLISDDALWIATILGILKVGKMYVLLDPEHPLPRKQEIWHEAEVMLLAADDVNMATARQLSGVTEPIDVSSINEKFSDENLDLHLSPDSLAYLLFTSGSTGKPKGVVQNHRNVLHNTRNHTNTLRIAAEDCLSLLSSRTTGQAATGIYSALLNGAAICPFRLKEEGLHSLAGWLSDEEITIFHSSASTFRHFAASLTGKERFPKLRIVKLGSEPVSKRDLQLFEEHFPRECLFVNALSSAETGMIREYIAKHGDVIAGNVVPVGYDVPDMEILLLGDDGQPIADGEIGEIAVRSRFLAPGYWRDPEQSQTAFVAESTDSDLRVFRTGDIGRYLPDAALVHLGRKDFRVKIRGNRVELAEIEAAVLALAGVKQAVVTAPEDENGNRILVVYIVPTVERAATTAFLRRALHERLPGYMVPSLFVFVDSLPLTPQGKIDRRALQGRRLRLDPVEPRDDTEVQLAEIWKNLLGVDRVSVRDDFFGLGGDSLLALCLLTQVEQTFGKEISPSVFVHGATVENLASALIDQWNLTPSSMLVGTTQPTSRRPFFYLHGDYSGAGLYSIRLAHLLGEEFPFYALQALQRFQRPLLPTIESMAAAYVHTLQSLQPKGPYLLGGHCNGGLVAFELAQQLRNRGETVELLVIIDAVVHNTDAQRQARLVRFAGKVSGLNEEEALDLFLHMKHFQWGKRSGLERLRFALSTVGIAAEPAKWLKRIFARNADSGRNMDAPHPARATPVAVGDLENMTIQYSAHFHRLITGYVPQPYPAPITLLVSEERQKAHSDPTLGWRNVSPEIDLHIVPGDHHTCLTKHLGVVAECLKSCLDRTHQQLQQANSGR